MTRTRTSLLIAALGLIVLSNGIALGLAAYNRSGEPDSVLKLSARELVLAASAASPGAHESPTYTLRWRTPGKMAASPPGTPGSFYNLHDAPDWLDNRKLLALGIDVQARIDRDRVIDKSLPRQVLLVLESNGSAYRQSLRDAADFAASEAALLAANPGKEEMARRAKAAQYQLDAERAQASRLFVIDAGLDARQLRAAYPDRSRYAIVHGEIRATWRKAERAELQRLGTIVAVHAARIHASAADAARAAPVANMAANDGALRDISVAFGRRLEPWIVGTAEH